MKAKQIVPTPEVNLEIGMNVLITYYGGSNQGSGSSGTSTIMGSIASITCKGITLKLQAFEMNRFKLASQKKFAKLGYPLRFAEIQNITPLLVVEA